jgi:hypothetical protein
MDKIQALEKYALDNYEAGGHWVYECFDKSDYAEYLEEAHGNLDEAKAELKKYWELMNDMERECAWE